MPKLFVRFKFAWWLRVYIFGVDLVSCVTGLKPDAEKVAYYYKKAVIVCGVGRREDD